MRTLRILLIGRKFLYIAVLAALFVILALAFAVFHLVNLPASSFDDPKSGVIVIDAGHGGIDGGANKDGIMEKDINLVIAKKLRVLMEESGYTVIMTREKDVSLDNLNKSSRSRHRRDLNARVDIINGSNAQLFISVHVNCSFRHTETDGSIVFYGRKFIQNRTLADCIQRSLNGIEISGVNRTKHEALKGRYFILNNSQIPGVIVETAFLSNSEERRLLTDEGFLNRLASAIANGAVSYLNGKQTD